MATNDKLTDKRDNFARLVAEGATYADAYRISFPTSKKWKDESVWCESSKLMNNTKVLQRIEEYRSNTIKRNEVTIDEVLNELASWLRFDPLDIIDPETEALLPLKDMEKNARMSLAEIHVQELFTKVPNLDGKGSHNEKIGELKKIKFLDKRATADMFMKKFGAYVDQDKSLSSNLDAIKEIINAVKK